MVMRPYQPDLPMTRTRHRFARFGPVTIEYHEDKVITSCPGSPRIEIRGPWAPQKSDVLDRIRHGIDVITDGAVTGRLIQHEHGFFQSRRRVELIGTTPNRYPPGAYFRARGIAGLMSLETPNGKLIAPRHPAALNTRTAPQRVTICNTRTPRPLRRSGFGRRPSRTDLIRAADDIRTADEIPDATRTTLGPENGV